MKKTLALIGAGALGVAAGGAGAVPAMADATEPCANLGEHTVTTAADPGNWYMDCVPQYGLGKAEFTIVPDLDDPAEEFPAGFADLRDSPPVEHGTTLDMDAINAYIGGPGLPAPIAPQSLADSDPTFQSWIAAVVAPVTAVAEATESNVPDEVFALCDLGNVGYGGGWLATFGPVDTSFTQVVDGESWRFDVSGTPLPVFYFGTIVEDGGVASIDESAPWCVSDGFGAITEDGDFFIPVDVLFGLVYHGTPDFEDELLPNYGTFGRFQSAAVPAPELAATGSDPLAPMIAGGFLALFGTALVGAVSLVRRRRGA